ncbi:hypothetical protein [Alkalihalobacterium chitinilyticum]|uniref:DUF443 family protein n=1 Tax=Alkalihalobacterium chitinilyticum TaxID=2980103 RepID=A0ABT5VM86_9BACI|nr:hypothetical protein [Alkalihalobacterium chitinilyticum]MDE5416356.1 hypothetical protein [Alkalihalobacterium chitinilyticum]
MNKKNIVIYANKEKGSMGYTLLLDGQTKRTYKIYHKEYSQILYWSYFLGALVILRSLQSFTISVDNPIFMLAIVIFGAIFSILIGVFIHSKSASEIKEIYPTNEMLKEYIEKGRKKFKFEIMLMVVLLLGSFVCLIIFLINNLLILLLFFFLLFIAIGILGSNFSIARFQIYKKGLE